MPEGPEVWILSKMINEYYLNDNTISIGKHLINYLKHRYKIYKS